MPKSSLLFIILGIFGSACSQSASITATAVAPAPATTTPLPTTTPTQRAASTPTSPPTSAAAPPSRTPRPIQTPFPINLNEIEECIRPEGNDAGNEDWEPCRYQLSSPSGKWLVIAWGPNRCGRSLMLINPQTGEKQLLHGPSAILHFFSDDEALLGRGHCEGGDIFLFNIATPTATHLGPGGNLYWNDDETAVIVDAPAWVGENHAWGFNFDSGEYFIPTTLPATQAIWAPDDIHVLYEVQPMVNLSDIESEYPNALPDSIPDPLPGYISFFAPRRIQITNSQTGETHILLGNSDTNFQLCAGQKTASCSWQDDWIRVSRVSFVPGLYFDASWENNYYASRDWNCPVLMQKCPDIPERTLLNWRAGETMDWELLWTPTPTPHERIVED